MTLVNVRPKTTHGRLNLLEGFDRVFDEIFNGDLAKVQGKGWNNRPAVNIKQTNEHFQLEIAAPGWEKADFQITTEDGKLSIAVEKAQEEAAVEEQYIRREFGRTSFKRSFEIPDRVNVEGISAVYNSGILVVTLPKLEEEEVKPRTIAIQ